MTTNSYYPSWWNDAHTTAWSRIKDAVRRDWEQTKHDLDVRSGHDLDQSVTDTLEQAAGRAPIPPANQPNPHALATSWDEVEGPYGYGYGARREYGRRHPEWSPELEEMLRTEWESDKAAARRGWDDVKHWVRQGYAHGHRS